MTTQTHSAFDCAANDIRMTSKFTLSMKHFVQHKKSAAECKQRTITVVFCEQGESNWDSRIMKTLNANFTYQNSS